MTRISHPDWRRIGRAGQSRRRAGIGAGTEIRLDRLVQAGLSPGGAQPKVALAFNADFTEASTADVPAAGFTAWLAKFDLTPELHGEKIERAYALMAGAAGIDVPETRLLADAGGACHFMSRRFDRGPDRTRLHVHLFGNDTHARPRCH